MKKKIMVLFMAVLIALSGCSGNTAKEDKETETTAELSGTETYELVPEPDIKKGYLILETDIGKMKFELYDTDYSDYICSCCELWQETVFDTVVDSMYIQIPRVSVSLMEYDENGIGCYYGTIGFAVDDGKVTDSVVIITAEELSGQSRSYMNLNIRGTNKREEYEESGGVPECEGQVAVFGRLVSGEKTLNNIAGGETNGYVNGYKAVNPVKIISLSYENDAS